MTHRLPSLVLAAVLPGILVLAACQREPAAVDPAAGAEAPGATAPSASAVPATTAPAGAVVEPEFPALRVATLDGGEYDLASHRGQWVVVNFWATWCAPCLKEMPELSALDAMRGHVEVVGLAYEDIEPDAMRAFLEKHPVVYPVAILDTYAPPADFATPRGLPMTYLVDPKGRVAKKFLGPVTASEIEAAIESAGGPAVPKA